jgi:hypothetical protein
MDYQAQPRRIQRGQVQPSPNGLDESVVLRLSRIALRAQPPVVRFIERQPVSDPPQSLRLPA